LKDALVSDDLFSRFVRYLTADGWDVETLPDQLELRAEAGGENGRWTVYGRVRNGRRLVFYSGGGFVPEGQREAAMELATRANWGLPLGNFELDLDSGELNYKTSVDLDGVEPDPLLFKHLVHTNVHTFDKYLPAIRAVLDEGAEPAAALAQVE
jgi:Putative bacterial sensory transduction regulator